MTSVVALGASMLFTCVSAAATAAVGPAWYFTIVFPVQAASSAVSGFPSDHLPPGFRWNVHVRSSDDFVQLVAQSRQDPLLVGDGQMLGADELGEEKLEREEGEILLFRIDPARPRDWHAAQAPDHRRQVVAPACFKQRHGPAAKRQRHGGSFIDCGEVLRCR